MMKIAFLDTFSGLSGDMFVGALISAGMPFEHLKQELKKLNLKGYELSISLVQKKSITATKFDVKINVDYKHSHEHEDEHHHHHHDSHHGRSYAEIIELIEKSELSANVKSISKNIFKIIGEAEAKIHNVKLEDVHFHEIGAIDSIVDIVGAAIGLEYFNVKNVFTSIVPFGKGFIQTQHGTMPIPAPATIEILKDYPVTFLDVPFELTTPTGAGIIKALSQGLIDFKKIKVTNIGYGAGSKDIPQIPNLFRLIIGEPIETFSIDESYIIETNIDDMNPEFYPYVIEKLLNAGAHDAYLIPIIMKKGRPGIILSTLCEGNKIDEVLNIIYKETTTLGVRIIKIDRRKLNRDIETIKTKFGEVKVKVVIHENSKKYIPEFEECKKIALEKNIPISDVYNEILKLNSQ
ncbi:MAG: nickel pincer cofactor biosynthesis protein LarC [Ignavibacteria bacterium]|nr:nickel pincer cofactor biosynthesis protein LarC [Ignavibacteria bacterium]